MCKPELSARNGEPKCDNATEMFPSAGVSLGTTKGALEWKMLCCPLPPQAAWAAGVLTQWKSVFHKISVFTEKTII